MYLLYVPMHYMYTIIPNLAFKKSMYNMQLIHCFTFLGILVARERHSTYFHLKHLSNSKHLPIYINIE